jgi:pyruvate/2-oxoglutarate dehydrogenase complex dihydrolipoamide acyltransferase (E2) component
MRSVITLISAILLTAAATCSHAQGQPPAKAPAPKPAAARPAGTPASNPAAKPSASVAVKPAAKPVTKKHAATNSTEGAAGSSTPEQARIARRDPFESLLSRQKAGGDAKNLPPGKGGLQVSTLRIDGIVHGPNGMIAVVSNPQQRTYFLHEGDQLYDGRVDKIAMDGVSFHETGKDAFGKPVERSVNKRIYSTAGEEQ